MKKYFKTAVTTITVGVASLLMAGCDIPFIPQKAEQHITLLRDGTASVTYTGQFTDLYPFLELSFAPRVAAGEFDANDLMSKEEFQQGIAKNLRKIAPGTQIESDAKHHYTINYKADAKLDFSSAKQLSNSLPELLQHNGELARSFPGFVALQAAKSDNGEALGLNTIPASKMIMDEDLDWFFGDRPDSKNNLLDERSASLEAQNTLRELLRSINGRLLITTDMNVLKHNADKVIPLADGLQRYEWTITHLNFRNLEFMASRDQPQH